MPVDHTAATVSPVQWRLPGPGRCTQGPLAVRRPIATATRIAFRNALRQVWPVTAAAARRHVASGTSQTPRTTAAVPPPAQSHHVVTLLQLDARTLLAVALPCKAQHIAHIHGTFPAVLSESAHRPYSSQCRAFGKCDPHTIGSKYVRNGHSIPCVTPKTFTAPTGP